MHNKNMAEQRASNDEQNASNSVSKSAKPFKRSAADQ